MHFNKRGGQCVLSGLLWFLAGEGETHADYFVAVQKHDSLS
jgi:hypothetical protein